MYKKKKNVKNNQLKITKDNLKQNSVQSKTILTDVYLVNVITVTVLYDRYKNNNLNNYKHSLQQVPSTIIKIKILYISTKDIISRYIETECL